MPVARLLLTAAAAAYALTACSTATQSTGAPGGKLTVVATMSTLASLAQPVAGDRATVTNLVPIGASPENYQPTPHDIATLRNAKVLIENGSGIETWLAHTIESASNPELTVAVMTDGMPVIGHNPHLWMNPVYAQQYVLKIAAALSKADPAGKTVYRKNAAAEIVKLKALDAWISGRIKTLPADHRAMIVFHNAWLYYNNRYGIQTVGAIELSPGQEPSPQYIGQLIGLAKQHHVRAVFAEPEYSPKLAKSLASDAGIALVTNLYDDSLSTDAKVHDYDSMLRYDTETIVDALK